VNSVSHEALYLSQTATATVPLCTTYTVPHLAIGTVPQSTIGNLNTACRRRCKLSQPRGTVPITDSYRHCTTVYYRHSATFSYGYCTTVNYRQFKHSLQEAL
jgi:hypothetical protein